MKSIKNYLLVFVLIILSHGGHAQKHYDSLLIGSWHTSLINNNVKYSDETISFYPNAIFQKTRTWYPNGIIVDTIKPDTTIGHWSIKNDQIIFYNEFDLRGGGKYYLSLYPYKEKIFNLSDSLLVFKRRNTNGGRPKRYFTNYERVGNRELREVKQSPYFYDESLFIINSVSNKQVRIKIGNIPTFYLNIDTSNYISEGSYHSLHAGFDEGNDSVFVLSVLKEEEYLIKKDNTYYGRSISDENEVQKKVKRETIIGLKYQSPMRGVCQVLGSVITPLSIVTALIVAPLASINYKTGEFNTKRYYAISASGLIGLSIGIPLNLIGRDRYYDITTKSGKKAKDLWYFDNLPLGK